MYWISFSITSIVMVALFVGTVTMSMYESMEARKKEVEEVSKAIIRTPLSSRLTTHLVCVRRMLYMKG